MAGSPAPQLVYPEPAGPGESYGGIHDTSGLAGYPARDFFAPSGTYALAPEAGKIVKLSGTDPSIAPLDPHGAYGLSEYLQGVSGTEYFITHLGTETVKLGQNVVPGQIIGSVADFSQYGTPSHLHIGTSGGPNTSTSLANAPKFSNDQVVERGTGSAADIGSLDLGTAGGAVSGAASSAVKAVTGPIASVEDAIKFLFSVRFLEILGGGALILVGVVGLMKEVGINVPSPAPLAAAAAVAA